jgi:hypothetical protein
MVEPDDELKSKCQNPNAKEMSKFRLGFDLTFAMNHAMHHVRFMICPEPSAVQDKVHD